MQLTGRGDYQAVYVESGVLELLVADMHGPTVQVLVGSDACTMHYAIYCHGCMGPTALVGAGLSFP